MAPSTSSSVSLLSRIEWVEAFIAASFVFRPLLCGRSDARVSGSGKQPLSGRFQASPTRYENGPERASFAERQAGGVMAYRILGPLEVVDSETPLPLGGPKQRALLALLLLRANEVVATDTLIDRLWGERPPATAAKVLQVQIWRLRKALGGDALATRSPGYMLRVGAGDFDLARFDQLVSEARGASPAVAAAKLRERSPSGAARLWPTWPTRNSPPRRWGAWRSYASSPSRSASRRTSRSAGTGSWSPTWRCSRLRIPTANGCAAS